MLGPELGPARMASPGTRPSAHGLPDPLDSHGARRPTAPLPRAAAGARGDGEQRWASAGGAPRGQKRWACADVHIRSEEEWQETERHADSLLQSLDKQMPLRASQQLPFSPSSRLRSHRAALVDPGDGPKAAAARTGHDVWQATELWADHLIGCLDEKDDATQCDEVIAAPAPMLA